MITKSVGRMVPAFMQDFSFRQISGQCSDHLVTVSAGGCGTSQKMTPAAAEAFERLQAMAARDGRGLAIASAHRSFERQLAIWNAKASGLRPVLDDEGRPLPIRELSEVELVFAILRWSALPGASRHHWGTDVDVYDASAVVGDYQVQLTREETCAGGVFGDLHCWLDERIDGAESAAFYRPFDRDRRGVAPEPWHLSYAPQARQIEQLLQRRVYANFIGAQAIALKKVVLANFDEIYERFIAPPGE